MTVSEYYLLKQQIILCVSSSDRVNQTLIELKEYFKDKINSPRRYEQIKTIGQLLHVLEVRDLLSESNVQSLKYMAQIINDPELVNKLDKYGRCHTPKEHNNYYSSEYNNSYIKKEPFKTSFNNNPYTNLSDRKLLRIYETVAEEIGTYWRDLARNLKIRECEIDNIEKSFISLQSKAERVLEIYKEKADTQRWLLDLCESLEKSRRKDLAKTVNNILVMNI